MIEPPCDIRQGTFLLKPNNCKLLGGEVLPLLNSCFPLEQYAKKLRIDDFKPTAPENVATAPLATIQTNSDEIIPQNQSNFGVSSSFSIPRPITNSVSGPSAMISRYFTKKPPFNTASTSRAPEPREISPDIMADTDPENDDYDIEDSDNENHQIAPRKSADAVLVSSLIRRIQDGDEDFESSRRILNSSPKRRNLIKTPPSAAVRLAPGILTSRRIDPMDEILENMIEKGEEPISCPDETKNRNPFRVQSQPPLKRVKVEAESDDDDIQVIELVTPPPPIKKEIIMDEKVEKIEEEGREKVTLVEQAALKAFSQLKLSTLAESIKKMKYSIGSKRFSLLAFIEDIAEPLRVVDNLWTMKVNLKDDSGETIAFIDNQTLHNLIGYSCEEAVAVRKSSDMEKRKDGKRRLEALEQQLQRLDLVFEIEFFAGTTRSCPVIRSMKTLAELIDIY